MRFERVAALALSLVLPAGLADAANVQTISDNTLVYGYNLAGNYPNNLTPGRNLTSTPIDCTGLTNTVLRYRRWLGIESATFDRASVEISTNRATSAHLLCLRCFELVRHTGAVVRDVCCC